jgi:hypothetical protein
MAIGSARLRTLIAKEAAITSGRIHILCIAAALSLELMIALERTDSTLLRKAFDVAGFTER